MKVRVLFWGYISELVGQREYELKVDKDAKIRDVFTQLLDVFPKFSEINEEKLMFAVNMNYKKIDTPLNDGDILSIIPPIAGG
jgi:MoaD family protein